MGDIRGSYAFLAVSDKEPGTLVGVRLNCPMVVGLGEGEYFLASDLTAFLSHTRDVLFLEDGEMVVATPEGFRVTDFVGRPRERKAQRIDWSPVMAEKGGFRHFMMKEIHEQPRAIIDTLAGRMLPEAGEVFFETLPLTDEQLRSIRKVTIVACGTSWHAALVGKFMIEGLARVPVEVDLGSEYRYRDPVVEEGTLCVCISQSGETADTLAGMREAKSKGATTISICNVVASTIARESDGVIYTHAGPEIGVASTKAFTTQLVALYLMALHLAQTRKILSPEEISLHLTELSDLPRKIEEYLKHDEEIQAIAKKYKDTPDFLFLGRGISYPIALEGALKLKEISYIHAEGYPAGEMKHGPIALIDERMPVLVLCAKGETYEKTALQPRGGARPRRAGDRRGDGRGRRPGGEGRGRPVPARVRPVRAADHGGGPAPAAGVPHGGPQGHRRGPAAEPGQERDGGVATHHLEGVVGKPVRVQIPPSAPENAGGSAKV